MNKQNQELSDNFSGVYHVYGTWWYVYKNTEFSPYLFVNRPILSLDEIRSAQQGEFTHDIDGCTFFEFID